MVEITNQDNPAPYSQQSSSVRAQEIPNGIRVFSANVGNK